MEEPRKATDVLLELELKVDTLLRTISTLDLNIKVISNKLNEIENKLNIALNNTNIASFDSKNVNKVFSEGQVSISSESELTMQKTPVGVRRTSRPETYSNLPKVTPETNQQGFEAEVVVPTSAFKPQNLSNKQTMPTVPKITENQTMIPVMQRVLNNNGKSVFLADVEILNLQTKAEFTKTRTSSVGKWMATLPIGKYRVIVRKREPVTKTSIEAFQDISIDGSENSIELPTMIIK